MRSSTRRDELTDAALLDFARFVWGHRPGELSVREYNRRVRLWHRKRELAAERKRKIAARQKAEATT